MENRLDRKDIMCYNYFDVEEGELESAARVNVWSFDHHMFGNAFEIVGSYNFSEKVRWLWNRSTLVSLHVQLLFVVVVNLSTPDDCIASLTKWLIDISLYIKQHNSSLSQLASQLQRHSAISYLKSARSSKGALSKVSTAEDLALADLGDEAFDFIGDHFSLPVVVVGTKSDLVASSDGLAIKRAREVQGQLRQLCLETGAALVYTSTTSNLNCAQLKTYIGHRLYPESVPAELAMEVRLSMFRAPSLSPVRRTRSTTRSSPRGSTPQSWCTSRRGCPRASTRSGASSSRAGRTGKKRCVLRAVASCSTVDCPLSD